MCVCAIVVNARNWARETRNIAVVQSNKYALLKVVEFGAFGAFVFGLNDR